MKNLYLLERSDYCDYDEYDSCVVCAISENEAKKIHPGPDNAGRFEEAWCKLENVICKKIGTANDEIELNSVVLASYNAG